MNLNDILKYGHQTVLQTVEGLPEGAWDRPGVCGNWSTKDIIAHLASFERVLADVLHTLLEGGPTPYLDQYCAGGGFNDAQVAARRAKSGAEVLREYGDTCAANLALAARIPAERSRETGTLPWYGAEYSLDDFVVYTFYGHKREHCAQIKLFRKRLT